MAEPTAAQRRMFAKMKLAMPDGSYYIRNGAIGASDLDNAIRAVGRTTNASGESAAEEVRKHIMTRAAALHLSDKIPDTWNPDGSLKPVKQSDISKGEEFLEHHGVKGMHWGVRHQKLLEVTTRVAQGRGSTLDKAKVLSRMSALDLAKHKGSVESYSKQSAARLQGLKDRSASGTLTIRDKAELALSKSPEDLIRGATRHPRKEKEPAYHSAMSDDVDEFLAQFGVKGMHWGVRKSTGPASGDSAAAAKIAAKAKNGGGIHVLTNRELKTLNERRNLEANHLRLNQSKDSHQKIVQDLVKEVGKQEAKKLAAQYAGKGAEWLAKEVAKGLVGKGKHAA